MIQKSLLRFYKTLKLDSQNGLFFEVISVKSASYKERQSRRKPLLLFPTKLDFYKSSFFPSATIECNNLDPAI